MSDLAEQKLAFLYKAIDDTQQTIRFIDTKLSIGMVLFGIYVSVIGTGLPAFSKYFTAMPTDLQTYFRILIIFFVVLVFLCIYIMLNVINPKSSPVGHIKKDSYNPKNLFFLFDIKTTFLDSIFDRACVKLDPSYTKYRADYDSLTDLKAIEDELIYELLKVSFIRQLKLVRVGYVRKVVIITLLVSFALVFLHYIGLQYYMPPQA